MNLGCSLPPVSCQSLPLFFIETIPLQSGSKACIGTESLASKACSYQWIYVLSGTVSYKDEDRQILLNKNHAFSCQGPLLGRFYPVGSCKSWNAICFSSLNEFTRVRLEYVANAFGSVQFVPAGSRCIALSRELAYAPLRMDFWKRSSLAFEWFHAWWRQAEKNVQKVGQSLGISQDKKLWVRQFGSLKELSNQLAYSPGYLSQMLKKKWGVTPAKALRKARLELAAARLVKNSETVSLIAHDLGYLSESSFIRAFRLHFGLTPMQYRAKKRDGKKRAA